MCSSSYDARRFNAYNQQRIHVLTCLLPIYCSTGGCYQLKPGKIGTSCTTEYRSSSLESCLRQAVIAQYMSDQRPKRETITIEEATIPNMWEMVAILEVLERFGGINNMGNRSR